MPREFKEAEGGADAAAFGFDPRDPTFVLDPHSVYAAMRQHGRPVRDRGTGWWLVSRHADVNASLRDRNLGRVFEPKQPAERYAPWNLVNEYAMLELEPPDHTRLRRLVSQAFTPRRVDALRPRIRELADTYLDELIAQGGGDIVAALAEPLPVAVIAELLGIPEADREPLRPWSNAIVGLYELETDEQIADAAIRAAAEFGDYLRELIVHRRRRPGDDLLSELVTLQHEGDRLSQDELIATAVLLLNAGHEASVNVIANGVAHLLDVPERWTQLVADPSLVPLAVEEVIRYDTPLSIFTRTAFVDIEVGGLTIPAGETLGLLLGSANRDPAAFADPDTFDLARQVNPHVGFGAGIHFCLGAALARVELQEAFGRLVARCPRLQPAGAPVRRRSFQFRGFSAVPVRVQQ